jgi:post-segregation antitoxin (ccd killing protein)
MVRAEMDLQYVRKTVTLPKWLNDLAEKAGVNFSKTLQTALKLKLDSSDPPVYVSERQELYLPGDD